MFSLYGGDDDYYDDGDGDDSFSGLEALGIELNESLSEASASSFFRWRQQDPTIHQFVCM
jgi:hypothetical protein